MHVSIIANLILVASVFASVLSTPIAYAVIPLDLAIPADFFLAFAVTLSLLPATIAPKGMTVLVLEPWEAPRGNKLEKSCLCDQPRLLASVMA